MSALVDLSEAHARARARMDRLCSEGDGPEVLPPEVASMAFSGMDVDSAVLNAIADQHAVFTLGVLLSLDDEATFIAALRGAYVEGILFGFEIREGQL